MQMRPRGVAVPTRPWLPGLAGAGGILLLLVLAPFAFPQMDDWWLAAVARDGGSDRHPFMGRILAGLVGPGLFAIVDPVRHYAVVPVVALAALALAAGAVAWAAGARGGAWIAAAMALTAAVALRLPDPAQGLFWWAAVSAHTLGAAAGLLSAALLAMLPATRHPVPVLVAAGLAAGMAAGFSETALIMVGGAAFLAGAGPRGRWAWSALAIGTLVVVVNLGTAATGHRLEQGGGLRLVSLAGGLVQAGSLVLEWAVGWLALAAVLVIAGVPRLWPRRGWVPLALAAAAAVAGPVLAHWILVGTPPGGRVLNVAWVGGVLFGIPAAMAAIEGRVSALPGRWWTMPLLALLVLSSSRVYEALADRMGRAPVFAQVNADRLSRIAAGPPAGGGPILLPARPPRLGEPFFLALSHDVATDPDHWTAAGMAAWFRVPQVPRSPEQIPIDEAVRRTR